MFSEKLPEKNLCLGFRTFRRKPLRSRARIGMSDTAIAEEPCTAPFLADGLLYKNIASYPPDGNSKKTKKLA
ncbi:MAG: hypothetical protein AAB518_03720 [Patescibacteria group bacterium]